jgi:hypothetical protein
MMSRRVIGLCAMLMLLLQGLAVAAAGVPVEGADEHCDTHMTMGEDCACCTDDVPMSDCATLCATAAMLPVASTTFPRLPDQAPPHLEQSARAGPDYLPLNPPPIPSRR